MNQREFDEDLNPPDESEENGVGWKNNPIRQLFENPRQVSVRSFLEYPGKSLQNTKRSQLIQ